MKGCPSITSRVTTGANRPKIVVKVFTVPYSNQT